MPTSPPPYPPADGQPGPLEPVLKVRIARIDKDLVVQLAGELDVVTSPYFLSRLNAEQALADVGELELDLTELTFLDVAGVRALLEIRDRVTAAGGRLAVRGLDPDRLPAADAVSLPRLIAAEPPR